MAADLASIASVTSKERKLGIREKLTALKPREPTDPAFEDSFGDQLSDLHGRHRWLLAGSALHKWHQDLRDRVGEVLRENQGNIYKGRNVRVTATLQHCWMMGYDRGYAHPTVIISCDQTTILKRTMRAISQHGVLKTARFALKGVPFCDLKLRMDSLEQWEASGTATEPNLHTVRAESNATVNAQNEGNIAEHIHTSSREEARTEDSEPVSGNITMPISEETKVVQYDLDSSDEDELPLRFGAEEIIIPRSGKSATLGGFLMVDDVCFGLTAAHPFTEEGESLEQQVLDNKETTLELYDSDWANEASDEDDGIDMALESSVIQKAREQRSQRTGMKKLADKYTYESSNGEALQITAKSKLLSANGLDWALCGLGDWGKFSLNGTYLPSELRGADGLEYLLFKQFKSTPPLGKVLVATRRGAVAGLGTGSDCSIKFGKQDRYRHVWSIQLEESLSSGDSGSWVVDAATGDVYGIVVAGSTGWGEEYVIPAFEIGQDICRVMRADHVRLPTLQDVMSARAEQIESKELAKDLSTAALGWESDDSAEAPGEKPLDAEEKASSNRFLLAEILKTSSIDNKVLAGVIKDAEIRPKWTAMDLPKGRSLKTAQRAVDRLLSNSPPTEDFAEDQWGFSRPGLQRQSERSYIRELSASTKASAEVPNRNDQLGDDKDMSAFEEPPELLDSNPSFRAEMSRRAWRAKRRADQTSKAHYRKHRPGRRSGEAPFKDPILKAPGSGEKPYVRNQSKLEGDLANEQGRDDPDVLILKHRGSTYMFKFAPSSIIDGSLLVGDLRQRAAKEFGVDTASRVSLIYKGKSLKFDTRSCQDEGLKFRSEVLCVIKRTPYEELEFLANKLRSELVPQGLEFISNTPDEVKKRDIEYNRISETILTQILMKSDAVDTEGDENAQGMRKELTKEAQGFLDVLDSAAKKDSPAAWHADFIDPKDDAGSLLARPPLSYTRSTGSKLRRTTTRDEDDPEDLALSEDESLP